MQLNPTVIQMGIYQHPHYFYILPTCLQLFMVSIRKRGWCFQNKTKYLYIDDASGD